MTNKTKKEMVETIIIEWYGFGITDEEYQYMVKEIMTKYSGKELDEIDRFWKIRDFLEQTLKLILGVEDGEVDGLAMEIAEIL